MSHLEEKRKNMIIIVLVVVTLIASMITIWMLFFQNKETVISPDYAPQEVEKYAQSIPNDSNDKLDQPDGGGSVSLTYSKEVSIDLNKNIVSLLFANPGKSNQDMIVQIVIHDSVIVQSGLIKPGNQVKTLDLLDSSEKKLTEGIYDGKFNILYYDQINGEKAIVNTEIPVTVTVEK